MSRSLYCVLFIPMLFSVLQKVELKEQEDWWLSTELYYVLLNTTSKFKEERF